VAQASDGGRVDPVPDYQAILMASRCDPDVWFLAELGMRVGYIQMNRFSTDFSFLFPPSPVVQHILDRLPELAADPGVGRAVLQMLALASKSAEDAGLRPGWCEAQPLDVASLQRCVDSDSVLGFALTQNYTAWQNWEVVGLSRAGWHSSALPGGTRSVFAAAPAQILLADFDDGDLVGSLVGARLLRHGALSDLEIVLHVHIDNPEKYTQECLERFDESPYYHVVSHRWTAAWDWHCHFHAGATGDNLVRVAQAEVWAMGNMGDKYGLPTFQHVVLRCLLPTGFTLGVPARVSLLPTPRGRWPTSGPVRDMHAIHVNHFPVIASAAHRLVACTQPLYNFEHLDKQVPGHVLGWLLYQFEVVKVDHVFVYDTDGSFADVVRPFVKGGQVTYFPRFVELFNRRFVRPMARHSFGTCPCVFEFELLVYNHCRMQVVDTASFLLGLITPDELIYAPRFLEELSSGGLGLKSLIAPMARAGDKLVAVKIPVINMDGPVWDGGGIRFGDAFSSMVFGSPWLQHRVVFDPKNPHVRDVHQSGVVTAIDTFSTQDEETPWAISGWLDVSAIAEPPGAPPDDGPGLVQAELSSSGWRVFHFPSLFRPGRRRTAPWQGTEDTAMRSLLEARSELR